MGSKTKYIVILLLILTAMLCVVGASTWVITSPRSVTPGWAAGKHPVYIKRLAEFDYGSNPNGVDISSELLAKIEFCDENGDPVKDEDGTELTVKDIAEDIDFSNASVSNGDSSLSITDKKITVGSTYKVDNISIQLDGDFELAGTYTTDPKIKDSVNYLTGVEDSYRLYGLILKYKTVQIGQTINPDGTWYTIEEALSAAKSGDTVRLAGNNDGNTVQTSFSSLPSDETSYGGNSHSLIGGATLLMATSDEDTVGTNESYQGAYSFSGLLAGLGSSGAIGTLPPANYDGNKFIYSRLIIPAGITFSISSNATVTVGGITGAQKEIPHQNRISGNYSEIEIEKKDEEEGKISSDGTLNVYGSIVGGGTIEAVSGTVRERFELLDWTSSIRTILGRYMGYGGSKEYNALSFLGASTITVDDPNEFPIENYQLVAIKAKLVVHDGVDYLGNARLFVGGMDYSAAAGLIAFDVDDQFPVVDFKITNRYNNDRNAEGMFLLQSGATLTKTVSSDSSGYRYSFEISGGAVGGVAGLTFKALNKTLVTDTSKVKFPVSSNFELKLLSGTYSFMHGYEFMGPTAIQFDGKSAVTTTGSSLIVGEGASLTMSDTADGIIFYSGSKLTVLNGGKLNIGGNFGGDILGEEGAQTTVAAGTTEATGYIAGNANLDFEANQGINATVTFLFYGTPTTLSAHGKLYGGTDGIFASGKTYQYINGAWSYEDVPTVTYHANGGMFVGGGDTLQESYTDKAYWQGSTAFIRYNEMPIATRQYYTFVGWSTDPKATADSNGLIKEDGVANVIIGNDNNLYAVWKPTIYSINYQSIWSGPEPQDDADYSALPQEFTIESPNLTFDKSLLSLDGYLVVDIYTDAACTTEYAITELTGEELIELLTEDSVTLYVQWRDPNNKQFTITYANDTATTINGFGTGQLNEDVVLAADNYTIWTPEGYNIDTIKEITKKDITASHIFDGWYIDFGGQQKEITTFAELLALYEDSIESTIEVTLSAKWTVKVHVTVKDEDVGYNRDMYLVRGEDTVDLSDYNSKNDDLTLSTYFVEWLLNGATFNGNTTEKLSYSVTAGVPAELNFTTHRENRTEVVIQNNGEKNEELSGYYIPESTIDLSGVYAEATAGDYNAKVKNYFNGWSVTGTTNTVSADNQFTVPAGSAVTINATKADKVQLSVAVTGESKITLTATDSATGTQITGLPNDTSTTDTYYLKSGTTVHYKITSSARNGSRGDASWEWSISGAADGNAGGSGSGVMADKENDFTMPDSGTVTVSATSQNGTCIVEGTLIMMADGTQKPIEDVKAGDDILVFNHETGKYEAGKMWFIDDATKPAEWHTIIRLTFSDGSSIGISYRHGFFDLDLNKYIYIDEENYAEYIGHRFTNVMQVNGEFVSGEITLVSVNITDEFVRVFGPMSEYYFNMVTDGLLSMPSFNYGETGFFNFFEFGEGMKYDEAKMQADIAQYGLFTYEEFADLITYDIWCKAPVKYLKISIAKGLMTYEDILLIVQWLIDTGFFE